MMSGGSAVLEHIIIMQVKIIIYYHMMDSQIAYCRHHQKRTTMIYMMIYAIPSLIATIYHVYQKISIHPEHI